MDETRRFLRYVLPGLVIFLQVMMILYFNNSHINIKDYVELGAAFVGFLASGFIGFLFSNLYYAIYWKLYLECKRCSKLDYKMLVNSNKDLLKDHINNEPLKQRDAWPILNVFFNLNFGDKLQYFERKTDSISNILAAIGTSFVIIFCGLIGGIFLIHCLESILIYAIINLIILFVLFINYQITAKILQDLYVRIFEWIHNHQEIMNSYNNKSNNLH